MLMQIHTHSQKYLQRKLVIQLTTWRKSLSSSGLLFVLIIFQCLFLILKHRVWESQTSHPDSLPLVHTLECFPVAMAALLTMAAAFVGFYNQQQDAETVREGKRVRERAAEILKIINYII